MTERILITPKAAARVAAIADKQGLPAVLRLAVDGGGCAGFTYRFELGELEEGDIVAEGEGATLVVDPVSIDLLDGSAVDFVENLGGKHFEVTNPNAQSGCGCGFELLDLMKIVTFNINGIRARHDRLTEYLEKESPDIVCLQELKADHDVHPEDHFEGLDYHGVWHGQKGFNGVAILAKGEKPELRRKGLPDDPNPDQARYVEAEVHGMVVASIYLPNGNPIGTEKFTYKLDWMEQLRLHAKDLLAVERPTVLAGDYNVIPEDRDTFSRSAMAKDALFQPESKAAFRTLVAQGWTDALRTFHPDEKRLYTFWDYQRGAWQRDAGFRIDHLLCSPQAADRLTGAGVDKWARGEEKASDHAPTWATFEQA